MRLGDIGVADGDDRTHVGYPGDVWHYAWTQMIIAARSGGIDAIDAIDGPYANFATRRLRATCRDVVHPRRRWQVVHPPQPDRDSELRLRADRPGDRAGQCCPPVQAQREDTMTIVADDTPAGDTIEVIVGLDTHLDTQLPR